MVKKEAEELISCLQEKGKVDLRNIGRIHSTLRATYEFVPYDNKIITPYLFGLEAFEMKEFSKSASRRARRNRTLTPYLRYVVATAAMVLLFFLLSPLAENTTVRNRNYAGLFSPDIFKHSITSAPIIHNDTDSKSRERQLLAAVPEDEGRQEAAVATVEVGKKTEDIISETETIITKVDTPVSEKEMIAKTKDKEYHIIASITQNPQIAQKNLTALQKEGYSNAGIIYINGVMCVSMMSFSTHDNAYRKLLLLRQQKDYENAWIFSHRS
jgi:hypothetical protein